jgi:membrane peptidoglycan carboxypeptidase
VRNGRREVVQPKILRRVATPETSATMAAILEGAVSEEVGTGGAAALERYQVAGKTGTAAKLVDGQYSKSEYNVSFLAFVPSRRPVYTILVMVDTPTVGSRYGGTVAAPIFKRIAEAALQYAGVPPSINPMPPIVMPADRSVLPEQPTRASAAVPMLTTEDGRPVMPDLRGQTLRDAVKITHALGLEMTTDGDGVVIFQTPLPGTVIDGPGRGVLHLRRAPVNPGGAGGVNR